MGKLSYGFPGGNNYYMIRLAGVEALNLFGRSPADSTVDFGVLIGKAHKASHGFASAGLGVVRSVRKIRDYGAWPVSMEAPVNRERPFLTRRRGRTGWNGDGTTTIGVFRPS